MSVTGANEGGQAQVEALAPGFFQALLDNMREGVSLATEEGLLVYTNPAEERMFAAPPGGLVGRHVVTQNAYPPEESARLVEQVIAELKRSGQWRGEWRNRRLDGTEFASDTRITAVDIGGRRHWLCVREDVTADREAAQALRQSEARLELAAAAADIGIWDWDVATGRMVYSGRAKAISGFGEEEDVSFEKVRAIIHPEDHPRTTAMAGRALDPAIREHVPYEYRIVLPDGSVRWVLAHGEAIFAEGETGAKAVRYVGTIQDVTERHRLEEAREGSEQRLRLAIDAGRMAVWEVDVAGDRLVGTPELNRLLGYPENMTLDIDEVRAGYAPGERERLQAVGQEIMARGERFMEAEYRFVRPDGAMRWMMLRAEMQYGPDGIPRRAVGVLMDVTERKETEEALRASEARLKLALQAAGAGVFEWDVATSRLNWSPELFALYGLDPEHPPEDLFQAWLDLVHPDHAEQAQAAGVRAIEEAAPFSLDFRIVRPDGETRWIRSHATVVTREDGGPEKVTGINFDVTDQHRGEERLRARAESSEAEAEQLARERARIYELSNDLFAISDFDGRLKAVNPAWSRMLGHDDKALFTRSFIHFIHPEDRPATAEAIDLLRGGRDVRRFEVRVRDSAGAYVWLSWSAVAEGDRFYAVGRDVTRAKEREEALRQAQKMEAVGHLTGGIAHDFNNVLQAVHGNLDLIRRRAGADERVGRWAEQGLKAAERGARLTAQLLAFSRAQKLELRAVEVDPLVAGMKDLLERTLGPMIRVELDLGTGGGAVLSDATQLEMALLNLAINARDAMPDGGTLAIRTRGGRRAEDVELAEGDYLAIEVADTGAGMPPEVAEKAFDPFFTTKGVGKGTGLGLSQVYGMARQAGGTARLRSSPGEGTAVTLILPATEAPAAEEREAASEGRPAGEPRRALILAVDDDPDVRRFLADSLASLGYRVIEAADGERGLALLEAEAPDLLLADYAMPGMSGAELADKARALRPDLPIVFASGYADSARIDAAAGEGTVTLRKPFRIEELEAALAAALG